MRPHIEWAGESSQTNKNTSYIQTQGGVYTEDWCVTDTHPVLTRREVAETWVRAAVCAAWARSKWARVNAPCVVMVAVVVLILILFTRNVPAAVEPVPVHTKGWLTAMEADVRGACPVGVIPRTSASITMATAAINSGAMCMHAKQTGLNIHAAVIVDMHTNITRSLFNFTVKPCRSTDTLLVEHASIHCPGGTEEHTMKSCVDVTYEDVSGATNTIEIVYSDQTFCIQHMQLLSTGYVVDCAHATRRRYV